VNLDGRVDALDLVLVTEAIFAADPALEARRTDTNGDRTVTAADLVTVLAAWR